MTGRRRQEQPGLLQALDELVDPGTVTDVGTAVDLKSTYELASDLQGRGFSRFGGASGPLLHQLGYSLQAPSKQNEGTSHPDRDGLFAHLNRLAGEHLAGVSR
ncbi:MAG TPA: hypothetical protein VF711_00670 [Acidimicrobiales bacterium]|jgi:hypothetical protein